MGKNFKNSQQNNYLKDSGSFVNKFLSQRRDVQNDLVCQNMISKHVQ